MTPTQQTQVRETFALLAKTFPDHYTFEVQEVTGGEAFLKYENERKVTATILCYNSRPSQDQVDTILASIPDCPLWWECERAFPKTYWSWSACEENICDVSKERQHPMLGTEPIARGEKFKSKSDCAIAALVAGVRYAVERKEAKQ